MASKACRWPGDDTPLSGVHGGTKKAAIRAIKESSQPRPSAARPPSKRVQEYHRAREIAAAQLEQLLTKLPPVTTPRKDRVRPKTQPTSLLERRHWLDKHCVAQGGKCFYCRAPLLRAGAPKIEEWRVRSLDHVVPKSKGGPDTFENTVAACRGCNNAKGSLSAAAFKADMPALRRRVGAP